MVTRLVPARVGDVEILVEATVPPGSQPTASTLDKAGERVIDVFEEVRETIAAVAASTMASFQKSDSTVRPRSVELEFGLKFSLTGSVILAEAAGEASLVLRLVYEPPELHG
ncbi:CU044_2847 family protein [Microbispora rosea]|uniref:CU044_2847 family protein n=1 Tax=Microbispora rosea TaxID=58117 RepID=UPI003411FEC5